MNLSKQFLAIFLFTASLFAAEITGTVTNKTTNKPAVGDDVILLKLAEGMQETARTKTDSQGHFKLRVPDESTPHLIRVNHRNVNYHRPAPPGTTSVEIDVYDAAEKLDSIAQTLDVMRIEADASSMRVIEMLALNNTSNPPRTLMSANSLEVQLPVGATIEQSMAAGPGGMPVNSSPVPLGNNKYSFLFPIRPGESRFQIAYTLPYSGKTTIEPKLLRPTESFAVSIPKSMQVTPAQGSRLEARGEDAGMAVYVAQNAAPGQSVAFTISGTGSAPVDEQAQGGQQPRDAGSVEGTGKPGGGLGTPVNTPNSLSKYQWWIIGGVSLLLVAGAAFSMSRPGGQGMRADNGIALQEAIKEELFRLESDRLQKKITTDEYAQIKTALDLLLERSMKTDH